MKRIEKLRLYPLENNVCIEEFFLKYYECYYAMEDIDEDERYGEALYRSFCALTPCISEGELIVGKSGGIPTDVYMYWKNNYEEKVFKKISDMSLGQDSHMAIDYELVLKEGINGIIARIDTLLADCADKEKKSFYKSCIRSLEAVKALASNYAAKAEQMAGEAIDETTRQELLEIARICKKVPACPAQSFHEAVQAVHFITFCISMHPLRYRYQQFQLGHPDRYLWDYYTNDIQNGKITKERAQLILDCLGIQINNRVPNGLSSGYMVGGRDERGQIVANELTLMCMQVVQDIKLVYPAVGFCYTEGMDDIYLQKACEILSLGHSHPAIFNDDVITNGLRFYGVPENEAHSYIHSTCVEITPVASSNVWVASPYTNMMQLLLDILDREYNCFDELVATYFGKLSATIEANFHEQCRIRELRSEKCRNPLLSCFVKDCLSSGTDIEQGGARYNWIMPSFVGMANLVDSLYAIKQVVFEKKQLTLKELKAVLDNDFEGNEALRLTLMNSIPKYGNDIDDVDSYFGLITEYIVSECLKYKGLQRNALLIPSVFCWIKHEQFGRATGATPDGRRAYFPLGDGSGPCQGREMSGPTASILSSTKWEHTRFIGGVAVNMKFSKKSLGAHSVDVMKSLVKTYLKRGGFEIQINVVDKQTLEAAVASPEDYRDLVVRIGGYSDYFVKLSLQMQQEVIARTEHTI